MIAGLSLDDFGERLTATHPQPKTGQGELSEMLGEFQVLKTHFQLLI
jgi:hypothetical protein